MSGLRYTLCGLLWLCLATVGHAEPVVVRSGQHPDYTRIVMAVSDATKWKLGRTPNGYRLRLEGLRDGYNLDEVFARIGRNRLSAATSPNAQDLDLAVDCDCFARAFRYQSNYLVVDIVDGAPGSQARFETPFETTPKLADQSVPAWQSTGTLPTIFGRLEPKDPPIPVTEPPEEEPSHGTDPAEFRRTLAEQIGRAASSGLIDVHPPSGTDDPSDPVIAELLTDTIPVRLTTSDRTPPGLVSGVGNGPEVCLDDYHYSLWSWTDGADFTDQLGRARQLLAEQVVQGRSPDFYHKAKVLIYHGFAIEALQVLKHLPQDAPEVQAATSIARIMHQGFLKPPHILQDQLSCVGASSLWAALAIETYPRNAHPKSDAILRAFEALPGHLKRFAAPLLVSRFVAFGDFETAEYLVAQAGRLPDMQTADLEFLKSKLANARPHLPTKQIRHAEPSELAKSRRPDLLVLEIDGLAKQQDPIPPEHAVLAASYSVERRDSSISDDLARAEILALAGSGAFANAYDLLNQNWRSMPLDVYQQTHEAIGQYLLKNEDPTPLLALVSDAPAERFRGAGHDALLALSQRLFDDGFPRPAAQLLGMISPTESSDPTILLRARTALALGHAGEAIAIASTHSEASSTEVQLIRAKAQVLLGNHDLAQKLFEDAGAVDDSHRAGLHNEDWQTLGQSGDALYSDLSRLAVPQAPGTADAASGTPLQNSLALISESHEEREQFQDLMRRFPGPFGQ